MIAKSFATAGMHLSPLSTLMVLMQLAGTVVARPFPQVPLDTRSTAGYTAEEHERPLERVAVVVICVVLAFALALAQGYRAGRMAGQKSKTRVSDILVFVQGFFCTGFLFAVAIQAAGLGLETYKQCYIGVRVCIVGYAITKMALYLFLFERVHIVRAPFVDRKHDRIYVVGGLLTTVGFLSILGWEFVNPMAEISPVDGRCRLGIEHDAAIAIIVIDTLINFILTGIFVWQLGPAVTPRLPQVQTTTSTLNKANDANAKGLKAWMKRVHKKIWGFSLSDLQIMVLRNVVGSILTLTFTLANNGLFLTHDFTKVGHTCMLICLTDVALGMLVTQWLTMRPVVQEPSSSYHSSIAMPPSTGPATRSNSAISGRPLLNSGGPVTESTVYEIPPPVDCVKNAASRFNVP